MGLPASCHLLLLWHPRPSHGSPCSLRSRAWSSSSPVSWDPTRYGLRLGARLSCDGPHTHTHTHTHTHIHAHTHTRTRTRTQTRSLPESLDRPRPNLQISNYHLVGLTDDPGPSYSGVLHPFPLPVGPSPLEHPNSVPDPPCCQNRNDGLDGMHGLPARRREPRKSDCI